MNFREKPDKSSYLVPQASAYSTGLTALSCAYTITDCNGLPNVNDSFDIQESEKGSY